MTNKRQNGNTHEKVSVNSPVSVNTPSNITRQKIDGQSESCADKPLNHPIIKQSLVPNTATIYSNKSAIHKSNKPNQEPQTRSKIGTR